MAKYKDQAIIGHFGSGFYSSFMVADKVEIITRSYKEGQQNRALGVQRLARVLDGGERRGARPRDDDRPAPLRKRPGSTPKRPKSRNCCANTAGSCLFPIAFGKVKEWKDGKYVDTDKDNIVNDTDPLWMQAGRHHRRAVQGEFYHELYPTGEEPLFSIHLNIDYPFHLTGILYFPKIRNNFEIQKNKIQLYSNQVFT